MPAPTLDPVSSELMLDTLDNGKLYLHSAHFKAIDLLLKQAGKADEKGNIAECRRCCTAILKFEITYPPKHAFWPSTPSGSAENDAPETEPPESGAALPSDAPPSCATATTNTPEAPAPTSPSLREGAGGRVRSAPMTPASTLNTAVLATLNSS